jgi:hypothetical protein
MPRCRVDKSLQRTVMAGFDFPLGVYPIQDMTPCEGYTVAFESADGGGEDESEPDAAGLEEWPDRYVWDIAIRSSRTEALCRQLFALLPGRVYPIVDVLGADAYRELDPYVAYDLVGLERFLEGVRLFRGFFFEDGLVGFGAMSDEPFVYVFVDEHKVVTVRAEVPLKERVERVLAAFDLEEVPSIAAADAALHEHRSVLEAPDNRPDLLTADEIVEELRDFWGLYLNVDADRNQDESGTDLGTVGWRCVVRAMLSDQRFKYAEVLLTADNLATAQELAAEAADGLLADLNPPADDQPSSGQPPTSRPARGTQRPPDTHRPHGPSRPSPEAGPVPHDPPEDDPAPGAGLSPGDFGDIEGDDEPDLPHERDPRELDDDDSADDEGSQLDILSSDRIRPEDFAQLLRQNVQPPVVGADLSQHRVWAARWME